MAPSLKCGSVWRQLPLICVIFSCAFLAITVPGARALKFVSPPAIVLPALLGMNMEINCTTDEPNATVKLLHQPRFPTWVERTITPNKLILTGQVFTLLNVIVTDGGRYNCEATYKNQTIRWPTFYGMAVITEGPLPDHFILIPDKPIIVPQGGTGQIICEAEGVSVSKLQWKKVLSPSVEQPVPDNIVTDVKDKANNLVKAILTITNAQSGDGGEYKCLLTAYNKPAHKLTRIRVDASTPPIIYPFSGETTIKEGIQKVIKCEAKASPKPSANWYRNGEKLNITNCTRANDKSCENVIYEVYEENPTSALHTTFIIQVLKIRSALYPRDHGKFVCKATNGNDPPAELEFDLNVQAAPVLKPSDPVLVPDGKTTEVSCSLVKANPLPTFTWEYKNKNCGKNCKWAAVPGNLVLTPTNTPTNESVVQVPKDQPTAYYQCNASNIVGIDSHTVQLMRLAKLKDLVEFDPNSIVQHNEYSTLRLACFDRCGPICPFPPQFKRDGIKLLPEHDARVNVTYYEKTDQEPENRLVLTIKDLTLNDSGNYTCISSANPKIFDDIYVTVNRLVAPKVIVLRNKTIVQGDLWQTQLFCNATGNPKPEITWYFYKDGKTIQVNKAGSGLQGDPDKCKKRTDDFYFLQSNDPKHLVICNPKKRHTGEYKCRAINSLDENEGSVFINVQMKPAILEPEDGYKTPGKEIGEALNVTCRADGNPLPNVTWLKNSTGEVFGTKQGSQQLIKSLGEDDFGIYTCIARNHLGKQEVSIEVMKVGSTAGRKSDAPLSTGALVGISIGVGVVVLVVLIICLVVYRRQKKQIDEYKEIYFLRTSDYQIDPDRSLLEQCNDLPYDPDWEFPEERLVLGDVLGAGAFGQVVRAEAIGILALNPRDKTAESFKRRSKIRRSSRAKDLKKEDIGGGWKNTKVPVAVKTLKEGATEAEYKDLASELKILIHLGQHKNIINLLGACTRGKRLMVIMEFAPHGSLLSFLRTKRDIYEPDWTKTKNDPEKEFTLVDLVMAGYQVSRGMAFLASKKCVHRDLAARNILVGDDYVMKIADFGLARDIYKDDLYVKKTQGLLPVKWMAPESLFDRVYTEKTDVWSFGILLWEVFTLGGTPYPGLPTEQLLDYLSEGKRMENPAKCPLEVYTVMRDCWLHEPDQRPHFTTLNERLGKILERNMTTENPYLALQMDDEEGAASQGYYLEPCDSGLRDSKRYVESPVHSPSSEVPNAVGEGEGMRYDSPLPGLPPGLAIISDEDIQNSPLPPIPPSYEDATSDEAEVKPRTSGSTNSAAGESGIDVDVEDDGGDYINDSRVDSPFLPREGNKPVAIAMSGAAKVPEAEVLIKGQRKKVETAL